MPLYQLESLQGADWEVYRQTSQLGRKLKKEELTRTPKDDKGIARSTKNTCDPKGREKTGRKKSSARLAHEKAVITISLKGRSAAYDCMQVHRNARAHYDAEQFGGELTHKRVAITLQNMSNSPFYPILNIKQRRGSLNRYAWAPTYPKEVLKVWEHYGKLVIYFRYLDSDLGGCSVDGKVHNTPLKCNWQFADAIDVDGIPLENTHQVYDLCPKTLGLPKRMKKAVSLEFLSNKSLSPMARRMYLEMLTDGDHFNPCKWELYDKLTAELIANKIIEKDPSNAD